MAVNIKIIIALIFVLLIGFIGYNNYSSYQSRKSAEARIAETQAVQAGLTQQPPSKPKVVPRAEVVSELIASQPQDDGVESLPVVAVSEPQASSTTTSVDSTAVADKAKLDNARLRWVDAFKIAVSTPRIQLNEEIKTMQAIKLEVINTETEPCMSAAKEHLAEGMSITIDGLLDYRTHTDTGVELFTKSTVRSNKEMDMYNSMSTACVAKL